MNRNPAILLTLGRVIALLVLLVPTAVWAVEEGRVDSAYEATWRTGSGSDRQGGYAVENPAQGWRAHFGAEGMRVVPLAAGGRAWELELRLVGLGLEGETRSVADAEIRAAGNEVRLLRGATTEWYVNDRRGLEHGFTLDEPVPKLAGQDSAANPGRSSLLIDLAVSGDLMPVAGGDGRSVDFIRPGEPFALLHYGGLRVLDAAGRDLPARMEVLSLPESGTKGIRLLIDASEAVYPIEVDPLLASASWSSTETDDTEALAWGDWDGDGDLDLAVANRDVASRIYENTGGALSLVLSLPEPGTGRTDCITWGDIDGDGDLDLASADDDGLLIYENTGGAFAAPSTYSVADAVRSIAWGDWDGDEDLDLAVGTDRANHVYGNASGVLTLAWTATEATHNTRGVAWGDMDGDGDLDLAFGNRDAPNRVYRNAGASLSLAWTSVEGDKTYSVAWGDMDGDGDLDLAVGNRSELNRIYRNAGTDLETTLFWSSSESDNTMSVVWGDWDGDGDLDLAEGNENDPNRVHRNTGTGLETTAFWSSTEADGTLGVAWGDWDGDGDLDLAVGNKGDPNRVYENTGGFLFSTWSDAESNATQVVAWGDWEGDGDLDLAVGNAGQANRVYENDGGILKLGGGFGWSSSNTTDNTRSVAWGDWDGDGDLDLAVGNSGEPNLVYENAGGSLTQAWTSAGEPNDTTMSVAWGDWEGDGDLDLAVGNATQPIRVYENTGGEPRLSLTWSSTDRCEGSLAAQNWALAWGDWDGDGDLELAVGNAGDCYNRVYENAGGSLVSVQAFGQLDRTRSVAWGDWDGDGDLDLAVGNDIPSLNRVYRNTGGSLTLAQSWGGGLGTRSVAWGDWDGDGDLDLALGIRSEEPNLVYENTGGSLSLAWTSPESDDTQSVVWGDWDGDGDLDLAVGNASNQANRVYESGRLTSPGGLPETPVFPVASDRPGNTASAFSFSTTERLSSPVFIEYMLFDEQSDPAWEILPEYSLNGGGQWLPATQGPGGDPTTDLSASPTGTAHSFSWDADLDEACSDNTRFRITALWQAPDHVSEPAQQGRLATTTPPFRVHAGPLGVWYRDADGDGHGDPLVWESSCWQPVGYVATDDDCDDANVNCMTDCTDGDGDTFCVATDCDDIDGAVYPGAPQVCDGLNNDCDHPSWPGLTGTTEIDDDGDGFSECNGDCDDDEGAVYPGAQQVCDGFNNDCDHPNWPSLVGVDAEFDDDADGFSECDGDCDDGHGDVFPGAPQICDGLNNDCDHPDWPAPPDAWMKRNISANVNNASSVFAADVDGDGTMDALSASSGDVAWHENATGDGTAWTEHTISFAGSGFMSVYAADVDGDGTMDALSASSYDSNIAWYENTAGDGTAWTEHIISTVAPDAMSVHAADVDGDGTMDALSASSYDSKIAWYENTAGDGTAWVERTISTSASGATAVFAADVDGDGTMDALSASSGDDRIAWYQNTAGDGTTWIETTISTSASGATAVFAGDLNGDGTMDALSASSEDDKIAWYENTAGDGTAWTEHIISTVADRATSVYAADVDGDGTMDVLSASRRDDKIAWYENTAGDGTAWTEHIVSNTADAARSVHAADLDGDGLMDILSASGGDRRIAWYEYTVEMDGDEDGVSVCGGDCDDADTDNWDSCATCADADADAWYSGCDRYETISGPDCDDTVPDTYPGASETNDGLDNQCPGDHGYGLVDEISGLVFPDPDVVDELSWLAQPGATSYEVARADGEPDFSASCGLNSTTTNLWIDAQRPESGSAFFYLVRALTPHEGSWGADSEGLERDLSACF